MHVLNPDWESQRSRDWGGCLHSVSFLLRLSLRDAESFIDSFVDAASAYLDAIEVEIRFAGFRTYFY